MTPLSKQPDYAAACADINLLNGALAKVQARLYEVEALMQSHAPDGDSAHVAAALAYAETGVVTGPDNTPGALHEEHLVLRRQAEALRKTIKDRQGALDQLAAELSAAVCRDVRRAHDDLCMRYVQKLRELGALHQEEADLVRGLESLGYSVSFSEMVQWPYLGSPDDMNSVLSMRIRAFAPAAL